MLEHTRRGRSKNQQIVRDMVALIFFLRKKPRTIRELVSLTDQSEEKVTRTLRIFVDEGLVSRSEERVSPFGSGDHRVAYSYSHQRARHVYSWMVEIVEEPAKC